LVIVSASEFLSLHPAPEEEADGGAPPLKKRNKVSISQASRHR